MFVAYYDEAGDDGFPQYSSPLFVLSAVYLHYQNWQDNYELLHQLRQRLHSTYGLAIKQELHTKALLLNKAAYRDLKLSDEQRLEIIEQCCDAVAHSKLKVVNVAIIKPAITVPKYDVLDVALTRSIQRIDNDLEGVDPATKFLLITDEGRAGKMRLTTRKIQHGNLIQTKFGAGSYHKEIASLIEDPLPKDSKESYFIQLADLIATIVYLHKLSESGAGEFHNRMPAAVTPERLSNWLERMKPSLNLQAEPRDRYGIVCEP
jgi:Protein of unknown function (DUF3800)